MRSRTPTALLVPKAAEAIVGKRIDAAALDALAKACSDASSPITDRRGTVAYRKKVVGVLAKRATSPRRGEVSPTARFGVQSMNTLTLSERPLASTTERVT